jgi:prolyl oligopeptidase
MAELTAPFQDAASVVIPIKGDDVEYFHGIAVPNPYRHLEDTKSETTANWVQAQQDRFERLVAENKSRSRAAGFLKDTESYPKDGIPSRFGDLYFTYHQGPQDSQPALMVSHHPEGDWHALINPNEMGLDGSIAIDFASASPDGRYVAYGLLHQGMRDGNIRIRDVEAGSDLQEAIPGCEESPYVTWDENSRGFSYSRASADKAGVCHHRMGTNAHEDKLIFSTGADEGFAKLQNTRFRDTPFAYHGNHEWLYTTKGGTGFNCGLYVREKRSDRPFQKVFDRTDAEYGPVADCGDGSVLMWTTRDAPNGKVVRFRPDDPAPEKWETVIAENKSDPLQYVFYRQGKLYASYTHNCADQVKIFDPQGRPLGDMPLPPQSTAFFSQMSHVGLGLGSLNARGNDMFVHISDYKQPGALHKYDPESNRLDVCRPSGAPADLSDCVVEQIWTASKDGTQVPMTVIRPPDIALDGTAALKISGYGGFASALGPTFDPAILNWVRSGGIYVQTNVRGGGEFGPQWHDQGRLRNKQNTFDDFTACAEQLVKLKYTSPQRMVCEGGSNGGLLALAAMQRRPDLYGAVVADVPVSDVIHSGYMKNEYGDPDNPDDFRAMIAYSPAQNIEERDYPALLVKTAENDVALVAQAYKFVATMNEKSPASDCFLRVEKDAGHGAGRSMDKVIDDIADTHAFIEHEIGPVNQAEYKQGLRQNPNKPAVSTALGVPEIS